MRVTGIDGVKVQGASTPPEARGLARDEVRMLVVRPAEVLHRRVLDLPTRLAPGDLLVVTTSATLPAAVTVHGGSLVHVSSDHDDGDWVVELRRADNTGPERPVAGQTLRLPDLALHVRGPHPAGQARLWRVTPSRPVDRAAYLAEHGHPISYPHVDGEWPL